MLTEEQIQRIELKATEIRKDIIEMLLMAGSGHSAGPLGITDVFATLYFSGILNWDPIDPWNNQRDRVILSAGHLCPVWYATLSHAGAFSHQDLMTLRKMGSLLQGHPHFRELPGVENSGGPLGQGLSQAIGHAMAARMNLEKYRTYCVMSDGELQEGSNWEAFMFAANKKLHNLTVIIDRNHIQIDGYTEDIMPLEPLTNKLRAFGWNVRDIDGHNVKEIGQEIEKAKNDTTGPVVIIAHTVAGKGVELMEGDFVWHGKTPNKQQSVEALKQLRSLWGKITSE